MSTFKEHFPVLLDYDNYKYYRVNAEDVEEFKMLGDTIQQKAQGKKAVSPDIVKRYFALLKDVQEIEVNHYLPYINKFTNKVDEYFKKYDKYYFESVLINWNCEPKGTEKPTKQNNEAKMIYSYGFRDMIEHVLINILNVLKAKQDIFREKQEPFLKEYYLKSICLTLLKFRNHHNVLSKEAGNKMNDNRITVIAAYIVKEILGIPISSYEIENNEGYRQAGKYYMRQVKTKYKLYFEKPDKEKYLFISNHFGNKSRKNPRNLSGF